MSLSFCILGSGSKGNCTIMSMRSNGAERHALIDCGLSPRATQKRLAPLGLTLDDVADILVTHLDWDHFYGSWATQLQRRDITVHLHRRHRNRALTLGLDARCWKLFDGPFELDGGAAIEPLLFAHDALGAVGFVIEHGGVRLGHATDLGRVPELLLERFVNLHALSIESNYDRDMQLSSNRPAFLKRRIMGGAGHLSNEQALRAVTHIAGTSSLQHVAPLHLSEQCNDPRIVKKLYAERAPELLDRLTISSQREPTPQLRVVANGDAPTGLDPAGPADGDLLMKRTRRRRRRRRRFIIAAAVLLPVAVFCTVMTTWTRTITPPAQPAEPTSVFLVDYGRHASLLLPRAEAGRSVEYSFGEWAWYAEDRDQWYRVPATLFWPTPGALARNERSVEANLEAVVEETRGEGVTEVIEILAPGENVRRLVERLDDRYERNLDSEYAPYAGGRTFVHDDREYHLFYGCNQALTRWLEDLDCEVSGVTVLADFRLRDPED